jgi:hypothetical protein
MAEEKANVPMIRTTMRERAGAHQSVGQMNDSGLRQSRARIAR